MSKVLADNMRRMMDFESPVYRGDVVFFNATLQNETYAHLWRPYVLGHARARGRSLRGHQPQAGPLTGPRGPGHRHMEHRTQDRSWSG
jgi:hypothetical protein